MQTVGEQRVRTAVNADSDAQVAAIKAVTAKMIDICESLKSKDARLATLAQTAYEQAAMWAVKAATANPEKKAIKE